MTQDKAHPTPPAVPSELLPCPFCGSKDGPFVYLNHRVVCGGCDAEGPSLHDSAEVNIAGWQARTLAAPVASTSPAVPSAIADFICRSVAELPDRNSPEDWPEAMLVTHAELRMIVDEALAVSNWGAAPVASNTTAEPAPIQPAGVEVESLPELPEPDLGMPWRVNAASDGSVHSAGFTVEQMRAYGEQCALAALATPSNPPAAPAVVGVEADAARLDWVERNLFERKWGGTIGQPSEYYVRGDFRHTTQKMRGETLRAAIDQALAAASQGDRGKT